MAPRLATKEDYRNLQGGVPEVDKDKPGHWQIKHSYREGCPIIGDHRDPFGKEVKTVNINGVLYNPRLLWEFHGEPCEKQSRKVRGWGYPRGEGGERSRA